MSLRLRDVEDRLKSRRITMDVDRATKELLAKQGYSDVVRTDVLFPLAQKLLKGTIRYEDVVTIRVAVDVNSLHIHDNHPPDASVVSEGSALAGPEN